MTRIAYICHRCGEFHKADEACSCGQHETRRADIPTPFFVSDDLGQALVNHADGKRYDSRSAFYKAVKAHGAEIVGNEKPKPYKPQAMKGSGHDIKRALEQLRAR